MRNITMEELKEAFPDATVDFLTRKGMLIDRRKRQRSAVATTTPSKYKDRSKYNGDGSLKSIRIKERDF